MSGVAYPRSASGGNTDDCIRLLAAGGIGYVCRGAALVTVPLDGEWVAAIAPSLGEAIDFAFKSDGLAIRTRDAKAVPHLDLDDAIDELIGWATGCMVRIAAPRMATAG